MNQVEKLAKIEKVLEIPEQDSLTEYDSNYDIFKMKANVTMRQVNYRIRELSPQLQHGTQCVVEIREILSRKITVENPKSIEDAIDAVMESYEAGNIVLDADDFQTVEFNELDFEAEL